MRVQSLNTRVLIAAGLVLAAFLSAAGLTLDQAFRDSAETSVRERLTGRVYMLLGTLEPAAPSGIEMDSAPPDPALSTPESGHYAQFLDGRGERVWNSRSMLGITFAGPTERSVGEFTFANTVSSTGEALFVLSYTILWEGTGSDEEGTEYTVQVAENERAFIAQVGRFRKSLWLGFFAIGVVLLLVQTIIFRWGLKPLRDVAVEVNRIERGEKVEIAGDYPLELRPLTENLNALMRTNESSLKRYRNALGDLAHSLKTPLAVIRTTLERELGQLGVSSALNESLEQLDNTIDYQLHRAAAAGRSAIGGAFDISPVIEKIATSLRKVHAARDIQIETNVSQELRFQGDRGDLMEIVGNLADNACKWARKRVTVKALSRDSAHIGSKPSLLIEVQDDGKGMPQADIERAIQRGTRLDETTAGHGIGLAVVKELVEDVYSGRLLIQSSTAGTIVTVEFEGA